MAARRSPQRLTRSRYLVFGAPFIDDAAIKEVVDSLRRGWIGTGPKVSRFEDSLRKFLSAEHVIAVNSCTAALHLSLLAGGIGPGDEVITTTMTFCATVNAIIHTGATPVLVDCERRSQLIDVNAIEAVVTPRTRAIVPVHLAGRLCDMDAIGRIAERHGLAVIEDAAHALESFWRGRKVGTISPFTCFSFYATKNITTGEGGAVATHDPEAAKRIRAASHHGMTDNAWQRFSSSGFRSYDVVLPGFKYNMTDIQAAIGIHQLARVEEWLSRRAAIWDRYNGAFSGLPIQLPAPPDSATVHARHLYTILVDPEVAGIDRDEFMRAMHFRGIGTGVHYRAVHLHPYYRDRFGYHPEDFPNASWVSARTVSLPLSPHLTDSDVDDVIFAVQSILA